MSSGVPRVLYVTGFGRSGSTLLANALGSVDGAFSTGELHLLWVALVRGAGCACGERVDECPVWSEVLERLTAARGAAPDPREVHAWQLAEARVVHTGRILRTGSAVASRPTLERYVELLGQLYRAIGETTGASVLVDSSKTPADAALLAQVAGIEPRIVHLVRDPRAVAFSQGRVQPTLDRHRGDATMHRRGVVESAARWVAVNRYAERIVDRMPGASIQLRYEDMVDAPAEALSRLVDLCGLGGRPLPLRDERTFSIRPGHAVWGNRSRFASGPVEIRRDDAWRRAASSFSRWTTTALTAPWLPRYGYALSARGSDGGASPSAS